jgi:hypothetical protein
MINMSVGAVINILTITKTMLIVLIVWRAYDWNVIFHDTIIYREGRLTFSISNLLNVNKWNVNDLMHMLCEKNLQ